MDNELCTLSEAVFEITEWGNTGFYLCYEWDVNGYRTGEKVIEHQSLIDMEDAEKHIIHPIYTSDYLLEKLPKRTSVVKEQLTDNYNAGLPRVYRSVSDTPLKALLKLTLALHEAGELK